mmetsp:Transcript_3816/g.3739  ORF Transcript_3816/g.3739 Transcript_3816/m.3739 type:complete len:84 (+) Transcript_3816:1014-1265(+)
MQQQLTQIQRMKQYPMSAHQRSADDFVPLKIKQFQLQRNIINYGNKKRIKQLKGSFLKGENLTSLAQKTLKERNRQMSEEEAR